MKRLLTTLVILTGLIGSGGAVWADAQSDAGKGWEAYQAGNYAEALKWYRKAAEQGHALAQSNLGYMYEKGEGVTQDYTEAVKWSRKAAKQGNANAQVTLGWMHAYGKGVTQDYAEAMKWYRKSAEQGNAKAHNNLGLMYDNGEGVTQDTVTAHMWFNIAAAKGNAQALKNRNIAAGQLSSADIVKAEERAKLCTAWGYKGCDFID